MAATRSTYWHCADGTKVRIRDMTDSHLRNAMRRFEGFAEHGVIRCFGIDPEDFDVEVREFEWKGKTADEWLNLLRAEQRRRARGEACK